MKSHVRQSPRCRTFEAQAARAVQARFSTPSFRPGTVQDDHAPAWATDDEADPAADTAPHNAPAENHPYTEADPPPADEDEPELPGAEFMAELLEVLNDPEGLFEVTDENAQLGIAGPGPSTMKSRLSRPMPGEKARFFDRTDKSREPVAEEHPTAGGVICMASQLHERWSALFGTSHLDTEMDGSGNPNLNNVNIYHPFASKMD